MQPADRTRAREGVAYGLAAFLAWGFIPLYFKAVGHVPALEVLAHRVAWSAIFLVGFLAWRGRLGELRSAITTYRTIRGLALSATLILVNWYVFIRAVESRQVLDASLGYYMNPLVNVALGALFLRERLSRPQAVAVGLALAGVAFQVASLGTFPAVGLVLAVSFGLYGLVRKTIRVDAPVGLAAETVLIVPLAIGWLAWHGAVGDLRFASMDRVTDGLLVAAGVVTALPLLWFVHAVRRLRYATVGILQYIAPTLQFTLAVVAFGEPFDPARLVTFGCIWSGLALYTWDAVRQSRRSA